MIGYDPFDWFWAVADGPADKAWSSAAGAYVSAASADSERLTRIASEAELSDVLRVYGLHGPHVSANDVRAEAQRRIIALVGASSLDGSMVKQLNAIMRATELTNKRSEGGAWTDAEAIEAAALQRMADAVKAIRAASNVMEPDPPPDFRDDSRWP